VTFQVIPSSEPTYAALLLSVDGEFNLEENQHSGLPSDSRQLARAGPFELGPQKRKLTQLGL
jgi:hypothetical protein